MPGQQSVPVQLAVQHEAFAMWRDHEGLPHELTCEHMVSIWLVADYLGDSSTCEMCAERLADLVRCGTLPTAGTCYDFAVSGEHVAHCITGKCQTWRDQHCKQNCQRCGVHMVTACSSIQHLYTSRTIS